MTARPSALELLAMGTGFMTTSDLAAIGLPGRAIDALLRACPTVHLPGRLLARAHVPKLRAALAAGEMTNGKDGK